MTVDVLDKESHCFGAQPSFFSLFFVFFRRSHEALCSNLSWTCPCIWFYLSGTSQPCKARLAQSVEHEALDLKNTGSSRHVYKLCLLGFLGSFW